MNDGLNRGPVLIQGPMPIEAEYFAAQLADPVRVERVGNFVFHVGTLDGYPVVVSKTSKGMENTAAATAIAIERYAPRAIINQGTAGGHDKSLAVGDIVLGKRTVNVGNFKTPLRQSGEGSEPSSWIPMDIMASEDSAGEDPEAEKARYYMGDSRLLAAAHAVAGMYRRGVVVEGTIGSANFWNNELDRIEWLHGQFGTSVEEMEAASSAMMAQAFGVPMIGIRVVTNNIMNGGQYDASTAQSCQEFVLLVVRHFISTLA